MKIVLILICGLVLIAAAVVAIGALLPKEHVASRSASYRATPEQLFALIAGPQNWRPDVLHWEMVPDAAGRRLTRETTRNGETVTYEMLDSSPPYSIKRRIATENLPYSGTWTYLIQSGLSSCAGSSHWPRDSDQGLVAPGRLAGSSDRNSRSVRRTADPNLRYPDVHNP